MGILAHKLALSSATRKSFLKATGKLGTTPRAGKFLLTYQGVDDPDPVDVAKMTSKLKSAKVVEVVPGTLQVIGRPSLVERWAAGLEDWDLTKAGRLTSPSPSQTRISQFRR